jgi:hypothetical protein
MNVKEFADFVQQAKAVIEVQNHTIHQQQEALTKTASALDRSALLKAASAVHMLKGSPSAISVETIANAWESNPSSMAETITKLASEQTESLVSGSHIVRAIKKTSSAETESASETADDSFWSRRAQR